VCKLPGIAVCPGCGVQVNALGAACQVGHACMIQCKADSSIPVIQVAAEVGAPLPDTGRIHFKQHDIIPAASACFLLLEAACGGYTGDALGIACYIDISGSIRFYILKDIYTRTAVIGGP